MSAPPEVRRVAERALLVRFHDDDLSRAVARAQAFLEVVRREEARSLPEKGEWILGAGSLLLRWDGEDRADFEAEPLRARLERLSRSSPFSGSLSAGATTEVSVEFGGEAGPDLGEVARESGLAEIDVVRRLCAATLTVAFVGFSPGFPYLIGVPRDLERPRLASPRPRVPAGSVAIAGPFAGIYPSVTPGGWRLLGRTDLRLFDPALEPPARLRAGDRLRFVDAGPAG